MWSPSALGLLLCGAAAKVAAKSNIAPDKIIFPKFLPPKRAVEIPYTYKRKAEIE